MDKIIDNALTKLNQPIANVPFCNRFCIKNLLGTNFLDKQSTHKENYEDYFGKKIHFNKIASKNLKDKNTTETVQAIPGCTFLPMPSYKSRYMHGDKEDLEFDSTADCSTGGKPRSKTGLAAGSKAKYVIGYRTDRKKKQSSQTRIDMQTLLSAIPGKKLAYDHNWFNYLYSLGAKRISPTFLDILAAQDSSIFRVPLKVTGPRLAWLDYLSNEEKLMPEFLEIIRNENLFNQVEKANVYKSVNSFMENTYVDKSKPDWAKYFRTVMGNYIDTNVFGIDFENNIDYKTELGYGLHFLDFLNTAQLHFVLKNMLHNPEILTKEHMEYLYNFLASIINLSPSELEKYLLLDPFLSSPEILHMIRMLLSKLLGKDFFGSNLMKIIKKLTDIENEIGYVPQRDLQIFGVRPQGRYTLQFERMHSIYKKSPVVKKSRNELSQSSVQKKRIKKEPDADDVFYIIKPWDRREVKWAKF